MIGAMKKLALRVCMIVTGTQTAKRKKTPEHNPHQGAREIARRARRIGK